MKNIRITFRLSPYQLARGLQTIRQLEPTYKLTSINELVKTIYHDYLAKMTLNKLDDVPVEFIEEIENFEGAESQLTLKELIDIQKETAKNHQAIKPQTLTIQMKQNQKYHQSLILVHQKIY